MENANLTATKVMDTPIQEDAVEGTIVPTSTEATAPRKRINDNGEINLKGLSTKQEEYYTKIASVLDEHDMISVTTYGSDLQRAMDTYSSDFLNQRLDSRSSIESAELISTLLGELQEVDIADFEKPSKFKRALRKIPFMKKLVVSLEQLKTKYNTIQKNIDGIVKKLEAAKQIAIRDNNLLQKQFENNCDYVDQLEDLIIAGKMKSDDLGRQVEAMKADMGNYEAYEISDVEEYKNALDKRISDLLILRYAFKQSLMQIRIIQRTNTLNAQNTESQITMTIPQWKNQLSIAVSLYNQKQGLTINDKVTNATNEILKKNAEMMKTQAIEVAKQSQRSVIDIETLRKTTSDLLATVEGVQKVQKEGAEKRAAAEAELMQLEKQMHALANGVADSTQRIVAKELARTRLVRKTV